MAIVGATNTTERRALAVESLLLGILMNTLVREATESDGIRYKTCCEGDVKEGKLH